MQDWAESKLLGSAPGYVGFSDSEPKIVYPEESHSVLLIDEIEKKAARTFIISG